MGTLNGIMQATSLIEIIRFLQQEIKSDRMLYIGTIDQSSIRQKIEVLAQTHPNNSMSVLSPTELFEWIVVLERFLPCEDRNYLVLPVISRTACIKQVLTFGQLAMMVDRLGRLFPPNHTLHLEMESLALQLIEMAKDTCLNLEQIKILMCVVPHVLSYKNQEILLTKLAKDINENTAQKSYLNDNELREIFEGVKQCDKKSHPLLFGKLLTAFALNFKGIEVGKLKPYTLASMMVSLIDVNAGEDRTTDLIFEQSVLHMQHYAATANWMSPALLIQLMRGLKNKSYHATIEMVISAINVHLRAQDTFQLKDIASILESLRHFCSSEAACETINILKDKVALPQGKMSLNRWLAHVLYDLEEYLTQQSVNLARKTAINFLQTAVEKLELSAILRNIAVDAELEENDFAITEENQNLSTPKQREWMIMLIGEFTNDKVEYIDLADYACSISLAQMMARFISDLENEGTISPTHNRKVYFVSVEDEYYGSRSEFSKRPWYTAEQEQEIQAIFAPKWFSNADENKS